MIVPIVGTMFVAYFVVHAFYGDRGIIAWEHFKKQVSSAEQTLAETRALRVGYERSISLLRTERVDFDMLDERARIMAGLVRPDEYIIVEDH